MDELYVGTIVDTPDGIGEVIDVVEGDATEPPYYIVRLEGTGQEIEYQEFELDVLEDYPIEDDEDLDFDGDVLDDEYEGDEDEFRSEFDEDEE